MGGSGNGGTSSAGAAGSDQGGSAGSSAGTDSGGSGGSGSGGGSANAGSGGTGNGGTSNGGTGGSAPQLDYEPVGIGDPWFFSSESDLDAFEIELVGATGVASWNAAGEVRLPLTFAAAENKAFIHFTAPYDSATSTHSPIDLTNRVLKARVRVASGASATGGVEGYSQSTGWSWKSGEWNSFANLGDWHDVEFDFDTSTDPSSVLRFGLQIFGTSAGSAEIILDDLRLEPKHQEPLPDGGTDPDPDPEPDAGGGGSGGSGGEEPPPPDGGTGEPDAGGGSGGTGGLGYEPVGIGDPWFFDAAPEMSAFTFAAGPGSNASETHSWSDGAVHMVTTCTGGGDTMQMQFTTAWNGTLNVADLSGRVLKARVRLAAGATAGAGLQLFAQSGGWQWANGDWNSDSGLGSFTEVSYDLSELPDDSSVQRFGVQIYCTSAGSVELIVDDLRLEPAD